MPPSSKWLSVLADEARLWQVPPKVILGMMLLPLALAGGTVAAGAVDKSLFLLVTAEDSLGEWIQVGLVLASGGLALRLCDLERRRERRDWAVLYCLALAGLLFLVAEEISWGQRIFGLETPSQLRALNRQGEIGVHNIHALEGIFRSLKFAVGVWGAVLPLALVQWPRRRGRSAGLRELVPPLSVAPCFLLPLVWRPYRAFVPTWDAYAFALGTFGEVEELSLYLGIFLVLLFKLRQSSGPEPGTAAREGAGVAGASRGEAWKTEKTRRRRAPAGSSPPPQKAPLALRYLRALEAEGIRTCLLRDGDPTSWPEGDLELDLLVARHDVDRLTTTLTALGFIELPRWGHAPHRFFAAYDARNDSWLKLDFMTDLRFGAPVRSLRAGDPEAWLGRRRRRCGLSVSAPAHEIFGLLLHCVLDTECFASRHRSRLLKLHSSLSPEQSHVLEDVLRDELGGLLSRSDLARSIRRQRWEDLVDLGPSLARRLRRREPLSTLGREVAGRLLRKLRPLLDLWGHPGTSVALVAPVRMEGATLARTVGRRSPVPVRVLRIRDEPEEDSGELGGAARLLRRTREASGDGSPVLRTTLELVRVAARAADFWLEGALARWYRARGRIVLLVGSVHDAGPGQPAIGGRRRLQAAPGPEPDLVLVLDGPETERHREAAHAPDPPEEHGWPQETRDNHAPPRRVVDASRSPTAVVRDVTTHVWRLHRARDPGPGVV